MVCLRLGRLAKPLLGLAARGAAPNGLAQQLAFDASLKVVSGEPASCELGCRMTLREEWLRPGNGVSWQASFTAHPLPGVGRAHSSVAFLGYQRRACCGVIPTFHSTTTSSERSIQSAILALIFSSTGA